jgi:uncharacterized repeat protein (TIGR01451 family)
MDPCDQATFTMTVTNSSSTEEACRIVVTNTVPNAGFVYVVGSGRLTLHTGDIVTFSPGPGGWDVDTLVGSSYALPPGQTLAVAFDLRTTCEAISGNDQVALQYEDCALPGVKFQATNSLSIEILPGAVTVTKTSAVTSAGFGDLVTWTLKVNSTGLGSIKNVVAWDVLGPGLTYVSSSPAGSVVGQTITWDRYSVPAFAKMTADTTATISLTARVTSCSGLENKLDARFGCADGQECDNTVTDPNHCGCGTATASVQLIERLPFLSFPVPTITIPYCAATTTVSIPITNAGDGTAHEGTLCASLGSFVVSNVGGGATYDGACFHLPDIAAGSVFTLTFNATYGGNWCAGAPSGTPLFTLDYKNDCGVTHHASPRFGSIGASAAPSLSVSKTGPAIAHFGSLATYNITATYSGPTSCGPGPGATSLITVTDYVPAGFAVSDAGGGTWTPGTGGTGGTITWTFNPTSPFSKSVTLQIPLQCGYCYTTQENRVTAQGTSCCGCALTASSTVTTAITCERLFTSTLTFSPSSVLERCGTPVTFTDSHQFANDAGLDAITFSNYVYRFVKGNGLAYVPNSVVATIDGVPTPVTVVDGQTTVQFNVTDPRSVRGHILTYTYNVQATAASAPVCGGESTFYVWVSHEIPTVGPCTQFYDTELLTIQPPAMSVGISGVPTIQDDCATYPVTITLNRTSSLAAPYDARLVVTGAAGVIVNVADLASVKWSGVTPSEPAIIGSNTVEWRFADGFAAPGASASLTVPVTTRCGGPLIGLSAQAFFDDRCNNTAGYNNTCSTSTSASSSLRLSGDIHITMTPEVVYTTLRAVTWQIELYNSSNGTAYNVYVDDILGSGLAYASSSASGYSGALTTQANLNHTGGAINGASFLFERIAPGERPVIRFTANLVACSSMTNQATVGWGCGGTACQTPRSDSSSVLIAPANLVATSYAPTPLAVCQNKKATITVKSTGIASTYHVTATATLPTGMLYAGNAEYRVNAGEWLPASAPSGAPGPSLAWTETQVPTLAVIPSGVTVDIQFDVAVDCSFTGGTLRAQAGYQNPCGQTLASAVGAFYIAASTPTLSVVMTQVEPAPGEPIACGGRAKWEIRVTNTSTTTTASAVWVEDTLGDGLAYFSSTGDPTYGPTDGGAKTGQIVTWEVRDLSPGAIAVLSVTADSVVGGDLSCTEITNSVTARWGCGPVDGSSATNDAACYGAAQATAAATGLRTPPVSVEASLSPGAIPSCGDATFTLTIRNTSATAPALALDAEVTLPAGLSYVDETTQIDCGGGFVAAPNPTQVGQTLTWYGGAASLCDLVPFGDSAVLRFGVRAACYTASQAAGIVVRYEGCCGVATRQEVTSSATITVLTPSLTLTVTPLVTPLDCGNLSNETTWTITVTNAPGAATADFVRIEETLGTALAVVSSSDGGVSLGGGRWGWELGPLGPGASKSVLLTVRLLQPANDCSPGRRQGSARATWGCGAFDGNPNTVEGCVGSTVGPVTAKITIPDLSLFPSDIAPRFVCSSDQISSGSVALRVRNTGDAPIEKDFRVVLREGPPEPQSPRWVVEGFFKGDFSGTLPLNAGTSQVLTIPGWTGSCGACSYTFSATLDGGGAICECRENNNTTTLTYAPTAPDVTVYSSGLAVSCSGEGAIWIRGPVTLRNAGCGTALTTNVAMRFTVYAGATCSGTVLDQWTQTFTGVSIAAGGTQAFNVDRTATVNVCGICQVSVQIEADYTSAICECSGANNTLCTVPLSIAFPDLVVSGMDFAELTCVSDAIAGSVAVRVTNQGCGAAGAFNVSLATNGCLTFSNKPVLSLAAGASAVVSFPVTPPWASCGTCNCTFTATVDTASAVCECRGNNNTSTAAFTSTLPDLTVSSVTASAPSPCVAGSAQVTVRNSGCGVAPAGVVVAVSGAVTGHASTTRTLAAGETETITVPFDAPLPCGNYSITATADPANLVCECAGANNAATDSFSVVSPDFTVTNAMADCNLDDTFTLTASVRNLGGQAASNVSIRVYADGVLVHDETQSIASGATYSLSYVTPPLLCATPHAIRVVADEANSICECVETNNEATVGAAECSCPKLSTQKSITNVWRNGASIGPTAAVESGDVIEYQAVITNNGEAIAFHVDLTDTLPSGLVYHVAAPGHGGQYTLSAGGSGTFTAPVGGTTFTTAIHATLASGQTLSIRYCALALSSLQQGDILTNIVQGDGQEGNGKSIPTGSASVTIGVHRPGLKVDKTIVDIVRAGVSRGAAGPVEPGDVIVYRFVVRNVGLGTAYGVGISEALPTGLVIEAPPGSAGAYTVTAPAASGSLSLVDGAPSFTAPIVATISGGGSLTATYAARVTSDAVQGVSLVNVASAFGVDALGASIPKANDAVGDTADDDAEDSDADDTGIASVEVLEPALSVNKIVVDVWRGGVSIGVVDPVLYGDVVVYRVTVRNSSLGAAYDVDFVETLPTGFVVDTSTPYSGGTFAVGAPASSGSLALSSGAPGFTTTIAATIAGGATLTATYAARVTPSAVPSVPSTNSVTASGVDGAGTPISGANPALGDTSDDDAEDSDADDTGIASVRVGAPALVTAKRIDRIVRDGKAVVTGAVEPGDILTYVLVTRNVGPGPGFNVSVRDELPSGFTYRGATVATWPGGSSTADPDGMPGPTLTWSLAARLGTGEELVVRFEAEVPSSVQQGSLYANAFTASGLDGAGAPIPPDTSALVPEDDDLDDSSAISVVAAEPALVTDKRVVDVARSGLSLGPITTIETGDVITFELAVTNVGLGTAYALDVHDDLPSPLAYVAGTTTCAWPLLFWTFSADPLGAAGPALWWTTQAKLAAGDTLVLRFRAVADGPVSPGATYRNVLTANGVDGGLAPIPADNGRAVARDTDFDDSDAVALSGLADAPALVTRKEIASVFRGGQPSYDQRVEVGDVVTFELVVENVGPAVAFDVDVTDALPGEFEYIFGSTVASSPSGFSADDPFPAAGGLLFRLGATLAYRERAVVRFDALIVGPIFDGRVYVNVMEATGRDETGAPIPADQQWAVPADTDADDSSSAFIVGRSWLLEGMGGSINVPILRKSAETLGAGPCSGTATVVDRVWFQTDIAMFAASEFAAFAASAAAGDVFPDTLLPTWARTVRTDLDRYAASNLLQVDVLSSVGVDLAEAPRVLAAAVEGRVTADEAAAHRLAELGRLAGVSASDLVPDGTWIYLEYAGGEPVYISARDSAWGASGAWKILDEGIVGSSLGMSLVRQAQAADSFLTSSEPAERYVGWVFAELMANKLVALNRDLTLRPEGQAAYVPHVYGRTANAGGFDLVDGSSVLFDQVSLVWGAARVLTFVEATRDVWPESERELALWLESEARTLLERATGAIAAYHLTADGTLVGRWPAAAGGSPTDASTVDVALLVVAIRDALPLAVDLDQELSRIQAAAIAQLISRQGADGRFAEPSLTGGVPTELAAQFAGIYGLLAAGDRERADLAFDFLEREAWDDVVGFGLYRLPADDGVMSCTTALDMGLAVAALRELAAESEPERGALIIRRLAAFARSVLDDAALELDNAQFASTTKIVTNAGRGTLSGITVGGGLQLSPVLQRSLCWVEVAADGSCGGLRALPHEPWYQTDIAMYASYVLQASGLGREDDADANLAAVDFHSGLGVPFDAVASLADVVARVAADVGSQATIDPIVVPYFAGDPTLGDGTAADLAWDPTSFDTRIVPSALGMTLLREAQEVAQLAAKTDRDADDDLAARVLAASIVGKLDVLEDLVTVGPGGTSYVPHAFAASLGAGNVQRVVTDRTSVLFDQISLLLGLAETYSLLGNASATDLVVIQSADAAALAARAEALVDIVLETLEVAHLRPIERALADLAMPAGAVWTPGDEISASYLGLAAEAFEQVIGAFGPGHRLANGARALLADEVSFLRRALWDGSGGTRDLWVADEVSPTCAAPTLTGQLGALRALLAADRLLGSAAAEIRSALLAFDSRFWDPEAEVYVSVLDHLAWCMTPLDFAMVVNVMPQATSFLDATDAQVVNSHLVRHIDRALDAVDLQIPARTLDEEGHERLFAPVFDRRVCLEPVSPFGGLAWTRAGDFVRYTVEVENPTDETFLALTLDDLLPEGVTLVGTSPTATVVDGRALRWTFDRLAPGEVREWTIDVRVDDGRGLGETLTNCATLTYTDAAGESRPTREACADVTLGTADDARGAALRSTTVTYRTDQAMRLAVALEDLADQGGLGAAEADARAASLANLGILLGESGLGVPFSLAPIWEGTEISSARLAALAEAAGLPGVPSLAAPIFLPSSGGVPILDRGRGFIDKADDITPAALGWTLAREMQFLEANAEVRSGLAATLAGFVSLVVDGQVAWLEEAVRLPADGAYLVHGMTPERSGDSVTYNVSDPRSLAYDQAALLLGLVRAAVGSGVDPRTARLAAELADGVFVQLGRHIAVDGTLVASLTDSGRLAMWVDAAVAMRALSAVAAALPGREPEARAFIASLAGQALQAQPIGLTEEAARIDLLLVAGRALGDNSLSEAGLAAWRAFAATSRDRDGRLIASTLARAGWRYSPAEAALAFELLGDIARADPSLAAEAAVLAADMLLVDVLEERVQLRTAVGYWSEHVGIACFDAAPVFAVRIGPIRGVEPPWTLRRP